MDKRPSGPDFRKLKALRLIALVMGAGMFGLSCWLMGVFIRPDLVTFVLAFALAAVTFGAVFYFGALLFERSLKDYLVRDRTVIKGDTVDMVTETRSSGDTETDRWVRTYVFSRNLFGLSLLPLAILVWLYFFG